MKFIDNLINKVTMYRLVLYGLLGLVAISVLFAFMGILQFSPYGFMASVALLLTSCFIANLLFAKLYGAHTNSESALITALILFCIFSPPRTLVQGYMLVVVGFIAMASKYLLAFRKRHIFNPAGIAAVIAGLVGLQYASWWVANPPLTPFVFILGLLVVRKIRRFPMVISFFVAALALIIGKSFSIDASTFGLIKDAALSGPLLFLGFIMLTEPETTPPRKWQQVINGLLVGLLYSSGLHIGKVIYATPEIALIGGNLFTYTTILRKRLELSLVSKQELGGGIYNFNFTSNYPFSRKAGQYVELTIPLKKNDWRGNRRTFTISSSPTENEVQFGIKLSNPSSKFKAALVGMNTGDRVYSTHLAGDFILPKKTSRKLLFIAGGIGVTPFRSMLKYLIDSGQQRDIVLLYAVTEYSQFVYQDVLKEALQHGLRVIWVLGSENPASVPQNWTGETGRINQDMITRTVPDYKERLVYLSGPNAMVKGEERLLKKMGIKRLNIKTDYFSGY